MTLWNQWKGALSRYAWRVALMPDRVVYAWMQLLNAFLWMHTYMIFKGKDYANNWSEDLGDVKHLHKYNPDRYWPPIWFLKEQSIKKVNHYYRNELKCYRYFVGSWDQLSRIDHSTIM